MGVLDTEQEKIKSKKNKKKVMGSRGVEWAEGE